MRKVGGQGTACGGGVTVDTWDINPHKGGGTDGGITGGLEE